MREGAGALDESRRIVVEDVAGDGHEIGSQLVHRRDHACQTRTLETVADVQVREMHDAQLGEGWIEPLYGNPETRHGKASQRPEIPPSQRTGDDDPDRAAAEPEEHRAGLRSRAGRRQQQQRGADGQRACGHRAGHDDHREAQRQIGVRQGPDDRPADPGQPETGHGPDIDDDEAGCREGQHRQPRRSDIAEQDDHAAGKTRLGDAYADPGDLRKPLEEDLAKKIAEHVRSHTRQRKETTTRPATHRAHPGAHSNTRPEAHAGGAPTRAAEPPRDVPYGEIRRRGSNT
ncbi:MAG: hypothetical protein M5U32_04080 [Myxococcota bacterium]|nr:hypothetical protein [Myxococcota bacterium]